ncbi:MAG: molybdenum cofactor biosysynthesis protein [Xanthomonadales bacterium]|nr:molybdenum cofactor biosysynthesis protein [Xanthomonadales bacterium]
MDIQNIFVSSEHGFIGQDETAARSHRMQPVSSVECVAGKGLKGDRFFEYKDNYKGQVTFFSKEILEAVLEHTGAVECPPWAMRRNVMVSGIDLNTLIGREFEINGVRFAGTEECAPCQWMNRSIGDGAREFLKGNGGLRARILTNGTLSRGRQPLTVI